MPAWVRRYTIDQWRAIDEDQPAAPSGSTSLQVLAVLATVAIVLTVQEYIGDRTTFERWWPPEIDDDYWELKSFLWWSGWRIAGYVVLPSFVLVAMGHRIRDYNLSPKGFIRHLPTYAILFAGVLPLVVLASRTQAFRDTYPFYRMANRSQLDLWAWELLYAAQFLALEFFFRGFILQGLRRALGANAIFVMIVPYCMIHYGKPMAETFGAIIAGLVLGTIALRTKSIWGGVLIHIGVAITMDMLALQACPDVGSGHYCGDAVDAPADLTPN